MEKLFNSAPKYKKENGKNPTPPNRHIALLLSQKTHPLFFFFFLKQAKKRDDIIQLLRKQREERISVRLIVRHSDKPQGGAGWV